MRTFPFLSQQNSKKSQFTPCCPRFLCSPDVCPQPMGHANISLTLQLYAHSTVETKQNAMHCMEKYLCFPFHWSQTFPFTRKMNPFTHISCIFTSKTKKNLHRNAGFVVEYRGVEPLASTMRMSRADKAWIYTPRRDSDDGLFAVMEWFGLVEIFDSDVLLVMQACFLRTDALPRQTPPKK